MAKKQDVPDLVENARYCILVRSGDLTQVLSRGRKYLDVGATTVFVWGGGRGISIDQVKQMVKAFHGRLNVLLEPDGLTAQELANLGVVRISVSHRLMSGSLAAYKKEAGMIFSHGSE